MPALTPFRERQRARICFRRESYAGSAQGCASRARKQLDIINRTPLQHHILATAPRPFQNARRATGTRPQPGATIPARRAGAHTGLWVQEGACARVVSFPTAGFHNEGPSFPLEHFVGGGEQEMYRLRRGLDSEGLIYPAVYVRLRRTPRSSSSSTRAIQHLYDSGTSTAATSSSSRLFGARPQSSSRVNVEPDPGSEATSEPSALLSELARDVEAEARQSRGRGCQVPRGRTLEDPPARAMPGPWSESVIMHSTPSGAREAPTTISTSPSLTALSSRFTSSWP